ncbi:RNB-domain-containing protein [Cadophora sp. DSE1049]|nr:RNB-domain-containing protein [Cadophora sp. DSE1049]
MLRSFQNQKQITRPFVCFRCLAKYNHNAFSNSSRRPQTGSLSRAVENGRPGELRRQFHAGRVTLSSVEAQTDTSLPPEPPPLPIRERLRQWEIENASSHENLGILKDQPVPGEVGNAVLGACYDDFGGEVREPTNLDEEPMALDLERFDMVDVGDSRNFFLPGDLVELVSVGNRRQEMAIYVRDLEHQAQFYTMSGRWINRTSNKITFFVPGFVDPKELDEIVPYLPDEAVDSTMEGRLQSFNESVPIGIGQPLVKKMIDFWNKADSTYQRAAMDLDGAHRTVADVFHYKYCTLQEIAAKVLPKNVPKNEDGKYEWPILYAVHRSIMKDDIGFSALASFTAMRSNPQYEINGFSEVDCIRRVVGWVRKYTETLLGQGATQQKVPSGYSEFVNFAKTARRLIDLSRANRSFTSHGTVGPSLISLQPDQNFRPGKSREAFTASDMFFIRFLESWACLQSFGPTSPLHGVGSAILRMINRYPDVPLSTTTAWTCLQELGALPPWEGKSTFDLRLPYAGRQDAIMHRLHPTASLAGGVVEDKLAAIRKDWGNTPIYCVDDAGALEIDDGFSLEPTNESDIYWVHVHVADPAAHLDPRGSMSQFAERVTETVYLPDRVVPMLPSNYTQAHFSLAPGRPCLTFSTKINLQGELLGSKITPGIVGNIKYLTKDTFREITIGNDPFEYDFYVVGTHKAKPKATRPLLRSDQISEEERENMKILRNIGEARREVLRARGGISKGNPRPLVDMSFNGFPWTKPKNLTDSLHDEIDTVGNLMILTGEVAARWCSERGIPLPYRITPRIPNKQDPTEYYMQTLRPAEEQGTVTADLMRNYFALIGKVQPSTIPGPHVALGVDMFARVTSPLRRFGDLLAHWQIEAALLEEAKTGQSLVGKSKIDFLPFTQAQLDEMLPRIASRERLISKYTTVAERRTQLQLVLRAWKFGEAKLPDPLEFTVRSINPDTRIVGGLVSKLLLGGQMGIPPSIDPAILEVGDRFEVEIQEVNLFANQVYFKCIQQIESESEVAAKLTGNTGG